MKIVRRLWNTLFGHIVEVSTKIVFKLVGVPMWGGNT